MVHTHSVVKKAQQRLLKLRRLKKCGLTPKTITNFYRCTIESILSSCITAWYGNYTAHIRKALRRVVRSAQRITRGQTFLPPGHLQHLMSQECHKDYQGHQPPEPLPVHPAIIQKARSVQVHQSRDRETEKQLLPQGHQTVKQPSLAHQRLLPTDIDYESLATFRSGSLATLIMFPYLALLISYV